MNILIVKHYISIFVHSHHAHHQAGVHRILHRHSRTARHCGALAAKGVQGPQLAYPGNTPAAGFSHCRSVANVLHYQEAQAAAHNLQTGVKGTKVIVLINYGQIIVV